MSSAAFETCYARLLTDAAFRSRFLTDRTGVAHASGLDPAEVVALAGIDLVGLELAARSVAAKTRSPHPDDPGR